MPRDDRFDRAPSLQGDGGIVMALKGDALVMMAFNYPPNNHDKIVQFARRVLAAN